MPSLSVLVAVLGVLGATSPRPEPDAGAKQKVEILRDLAASAVARAGAARAIGALAADGKLGPVSSDAVAALTKAVSDGDVQVRREALGALKEFGAAAEPAVAAAADALGDSEPATRRAAAEVLAAIGPRAREAVPALIAALDDPNEHTLAQVILALGAIGPEAREAIAVLQLLAASDEDEIQKAAEKALTKMAR